MLLVLIIIRPNLRPRATFFLNFTRFRSYKTKSPLLFKIIVFPLIQVYNPQKDNREIENREIANRETDLKVNRGRGKSQTGTERDRKTETPKKLFAR